MFRNDLVIFAKLLWAYTKVSVWDYYDFKTKFYSV